MSNVQSRISAREGLPVALDITFFRDGIAADPFAIRRVDIYKSSVREENLVAQFPFVDPGSSSYPSPAEHRVDSSGNPIPGGFRLIFQVPKEFGQDIYFDVWRFIPDPLGSGESLGSNGDGDEDDEAESIPGCDDDVSHAGSNLVSQSGRFFVFADGWFLDEGLENIRIGFEPLDAKFKRPERRMLEVGLTPLPLFDYNSNLVMPILAQLKATIRVETENNEVLIADEPCTIGLRMGSFRHSPFVVQYIFDTSRFIIGTYRYQITARLPNGQTRVSDKFIISIG